MSRCCPCRSRIRDRQDGIGRQGSTLAHRYDFGFTLVVGARENGNARHALRDLDFSASANGEIGAAGRSAPHRIADWRCRGRGCSRRAAGLAISSSISGQIRRSITCLANSSARAVTSPSEHSPPGSRENPLAQTGCSPSPWLLAEGRRPPGRSKTRRQSLTPQNEVTKEQLRIPRPTRVPSRSKKA